MDPSHSQDDLPSAARGAADPACSAVTPATAGQGKVPPQDPLDVADTHRLVPESRLARACYLVLGFLFIGLGLIGAVLPVMPTTIFLILAAWCMARSSPRMEAWLLSHPTFGPTLRDWQRNGAISRKGKALACTGMTAGYVIFWLSVRPQWPLATVVGVFMAACAAYVLSRPAPPV
ncbi:Similar to hypothetical protein DUF454 [plant metagenome]|uniref:DUF454 domain-containing protein n=1 Tax=plant metagenome TaxID=1297885 RepID=A0A484S8I6_9ZZZZ